MDDVENNVAVTQEVAPSETSPQESIQTQETPIDSKQERNWRQMRLKNDELEKKAKAQEEVISALLRQQTQPQHVRQEEIDELDSIPDADYIPKGYVKKLLKKETELIKKEAREEALRLMEEQERANFHVKLKNKFADFDDVVTPETLELLEQNDPELATSIAEMKDPYKMGMQTYKYIKSLGLSDKVNSHKRSKEVDKRLDQNSKTVQSPQAYDKRPMAQTFQMTEQMKQDLWKEMNHFGSMASGVPSL